ncbi:PKD domain-containing protein [Rapidithrix thailandica]|uniref:PKD domain-containing protein n=1 Tax=Rapidithrix thailandica TaxID=413964 RepID=A0AAW9RV66_9BACT
MNIFFQYFESTNKKSFIKKILILPLGFHVAIIICLCFASLRVANAQNLINIGTISNNHAFTKQVGDNTSSGNNSSAQAGNDVHYSFSTGTEMSLRIDLNLSGYTLPAGTIYLYNEHSNLLGQSTTSPVGGVNVLGVNDLPIGDYKLVVDTEAGHDGTFELQFRPLIAKFQLNPSTGCNTPHTVFFTDQSVLPDTWKWEFGDGSTSTAQNPIHTYTSAGEFQIKLTIKDTMVNLSSVSYGTVKVSFSTADFTGSTLFGCGPLTTTFTDASSTSTGATLTDWLWDFGDGNTSTKQNPTHVYEKPGIYTVKLKVTDSNGCTDQKTRTNYVQVIGPDIKFTASHTGNDYSFTDATASGAPLTSWKWNFGDGSTSNTQNPTHTYTTEGVYEVSLTVTDLDGCSRTLTKTNFINTIPGAYDISNAIFAGDEDCFSIGNENHFANSLSFNHDGTKMFVLGGVGKDIKEYLLSIPFDVSTAVYAGDDEKFSVAAQEKNPVSFLFNTDGSKMFVLGHDGRDVKEYQLSTPFDVSTATYAGDSQRFSLAAQVSSPHSLAFSHDGTKMFVLERNKQDIYEYSLSTAFDVSTAIYAGDSQRFSVSAQETSPTSLAFNHDGTKMFAVGTSGDDINEYSLSTPFDVSTATYAGDLERFSVVAQERHPKSLVFNVDGTKMFVVGTMGNEIIEYSLVAPVVTGAVTNQTINDKASINPFAAITVQDPNGDNVSATITLDDNAKGILTGAGLTGTGPYVLAITDATSLQASLRALVFNPTDNRVALGDTETCTFTLEVSDGGRSDIDNRTTVITSPVAPAVSITSTATSPTNTFHVTITFNEAVTGFEIGDISINNGTASDFNAVSPSVYTATITPTTDGQVTVDIAAGVARDAGGADNTAASPFSIHADMTSPTVTITSGATSPTDGAFTATFTFSEDVTGFAISDLTVGNGTASDFTATSASVYTALITPASDGTVTVDVPANVAQDAATNGNTAAPRFSMDYDGSVTQVLCQNITVSLDANGMATIEASQIDHGSSDNYGIASMALDKTSFDCSKIGSNQVTLTVTDVNGNTGSCTAMVTVEDVTPPTVLVKDITVQLNTNGQATITVDDMDNGSSDNCGIASRTLDISSFEIPKTPSTPVTLTVTDLSGNKALGTATVTFLKVPQTILFSPLPDKKVGANPVTLQATGGESGLPVSFSIETQPTSGVASLTGNTIIIEGVGTVTVTARQEGNDIFSEAQRVTQTFEITANELFLPTLFSPNGDQMNDRFILRGGGNVASISFRIFDREGKEVFHSDNWEELSRSGWDGTSEGKKQPQGTYIWTLKGQFTNGTPLSIANKDSGIIRLAR